MLDQVDNLLPADGAVYLYQDFLSKSAATSLMKHLNQETNWTQREIIIFGRPVMQPRLMAWYGDREYRYSGICLSPSKWTSTVLTLKQRIERLSGAEFNTALLNLYRDGNDSMGWHQDNERTLGKNPVIASLSLGAERKFKLSLIHI